ncbi:MAG: 5'/3'-nucleotidase SurE [Lachnospiraceae bacterium]|nr:5'/3'-nucleotidase SurE [Lachnospiraceae bacterium]
MRSILITNDDGILSEGLLRLAAAAKRFGDVWVVAPAEQTSAASHCITLRKPLDVYPVDFPVDGVHAFSCSGMPGDCVRVGCLGVMDHKPDVVLSGINFGYNVASDVQYSATVGGAMEASFQEIRGIAISEGIHFREVTDACLGSVLESVIDRPIPEGRILNVNFPDCKMEDYRGILEDRKVSRGMVYKDRYNVVEKLDRGGVRWMVEGILTPEAEEGTDYRAVLDGYISIGLVNNVGYGDEN